MRIKNIDTIVAAAVIAMTMASSAQAASRILSDQPYGSVIPDPQNETVYRPTCWTDESQERWPRCEFRGSAGSWHSLLRDRHFR